MKSPNISVKLNHNKDHDTTKEMKDRGTGIFPQHTIAGLNHGT